ncbi:hypothetical protein [Aporhodopirellula aestuarii]|nr:hypothetical protein [Aporhodopirellula aestuarii]
MALRESASLAFASITEPPFAFGGNGAHPSAESSDSGGTDVDR